MIYLKLYENFDNSDYYSRINIGDFVGRINGNALEEFTDNEISILNSGLINYEIIDNLGCLLEVKKKDRKNKKNKPMLYLGYLIDIYKSKDEYYMVRIYCLSDDVNISYSNTFTYFRCDQFDGLLKLLEDIKIFKN